MAPSRTYKSIGATVLFHLAYSGVTSTFKEISVLKEQGSLKGMIQCASWQWLAVTGSMTDMEVKLDSEVAHVFTSKMTTSWKLWNPALRKK